MSLYSDKLRFTGLSGIDTQSMVQQLMKAESLKLNRLKSQNTTLAWQQEIYRKHASSLQAFQTSYLSYTNTATNLRSATSFKSMTTTLKQNGVDSTAIRIVSSAGATAGSYSIDVEQLAQKTSFVGSKQITGPTTTGDIDFAKMLDRANSNTALSLNVTLSGVTKTVTISATDLADIDSGFPTNADKVAALANKINAGLATAFGTDAAHGTQKISATGNGSKIVFETTAGQGFSISEANLRVSSATTVSPFTDATVGLLRTKFAGGDGVSIFKMAVDSGTTPIPMISFEITAGMTAAQFIDEINKRSASGVKASIDGGGNLVFSSTNSAKDVKIHFGTDSNDTFSADVKALLGFTSSGTKIELPNTKGDMSIGDGITNALNTRDSLEKVFGITGPVTFGINGKSFTFQKETSINDMLNMVNSDSTANVKMSYDKLTQKFTIEGKNSGGINDFNIVDNNDFLKDSLGIDPAVKATTAQDSVIDFNGQRISNVSNTVSINGFTLQLNAVTVTRDLSNNITARNTITLGAANDTQKTYDLIKEFVAKYNELISGINKEVDASRPKSGKRTYFQPLTDEEKKSMSDREVELWEEKAKTGLLRGDSILSGITATMRSMLYAPVELPDGTKLSLYQIGITTSSSYNDKGKLVIDEDKLKKAIEERSDDIATLFTKSSNYQYGDKTNKSRRMSEQGLSERLNDIINDAIGSSGSISQKAGIPGTLSELTSDMFKQMKAQQEKIDDMLVYLYRKEEAYYAQFARMEAAMNQSNSQMSYMLSMMGQQ